MKEEEVAKRRARRIGLLVLRSLLDCWGQGCPRSLALLPAGFAAAVCGADHQLWCHGPGAKRGSRQRAMERPSWRSRCGRQRRLVVVMMMTRIAVDLLLLLLMAWPVAVVAAAAAAAAAAATARPWSTARGGYSRRGQAISGARHAGESYAPGAGARIGVVGVLARRSPPTLRLGAQPTEKKPDRWSIQPPPQAVRHAIPLSLSS